MSLNLVCGYIIASLILLITPGPNLLAVVGRGLGQGRSAAVITVLGYALGDMIQTILAVMGLSVIVRTSAYAFNVIKMAGAAYLIYLGLMSLFCRSKSVNNGMKKKTVPIVILRQSILASLLNPKTALFFLAFLPQFVNVSAGHVDLQMLFLGFIFMLLGIVTYLPIAWFSGIVGRLFMDGKAASKMKFITGGIFIFLGIRVALLKSNNWN